ncbi:MAG: dipeptide epimerase [Acidobacteria bacterium]|nr:dipeptide epimerase [Acidobacteriota bacterium]
MRIVDVEVRPVRTPITVPYRIAGRTFDTAEMILLTIRDDAGREGYGAAAPVPPLTGDDFDSAARALDDRIAPAVRGLDPSDLDAAIAAAASASPEARSALAAIDIALHDLHAKIRGVSLVRLLGGARRRLVTSITVGIGDPRGTAEAARRHAARGFRSIKVKIGENAEQDLETLARVREAVGPAVAIRVDANQGYSPGEALKVAAALPALGVELFEQPVPAGDLDGMRRVTEGSAPPVVADEGVKTAADLDRLTRAGAARGANIKLMKCGGIAEARRIDAALHRAGWRALVGCMDESRASIAAAAHFAAAADSVAWIDLDGHLDLAADPFEGGFELVDGEIVLGDDPGMGVTPGRSAR